MLLPGCAGEKTNLVEPRARAGRQQAQVVGDARERHCQGAQAAGEVDRVRHVLHGLEHVPGRPQRPTGQLAQAHHHPLVVLRVCVEPGACRGATDTDAAQPVTGRHDALLVVAHCLRVRLELLPETNRHGVLQMGASGLDHVVELASLFRERVRQGIHLPQQLVQTPERAEADDRRDGIIGALGHVDVVVRLHGLVRVGQAEAQDLVGPVGDHLVDVHVVARARARLERIHDELVRVLAVQDLLCRLHDGVREFRLEQPQVPIDLRGRTLEQRERQDENRVGSPAADLEVVDRALRLRPPQRIRGHLHLTHRVLFDTIRFSHRYRPPSRSNLT